MPADPGTAPPAPRRVRRQLALPFRRGASEGADDGESTAGGRPRPRLLTPKQLCAVYPIKARTLKYWIQRSVDREVSCQGKRGVLPGNGLAPAVVRKGRIILIDEDLFLAWLYGAPG